MKQREWIEKLVSKLKRGFQSFKSFHSRLFKNKKKEVISPMRSGGGESVFNPFVFGNEWVQSMHTSIFFAQNVPNLKGSFFKWVQLTLAFFFVNPPLMTYTIKYISYYRTQFINFNICILIFVLTILTFTFYFDNILNIHKQGVITIKANIQNGRIINKCKKKRNCFHNSYI